MRAGHQILEAGFLRTSTSFQPLASMTLLYPSMVRSPEFKHEPSYAGTETKDVRTSPSCPSLVFTHHDVNFVSEQVGSAQVGKKGIGDLGLGILAEERSLAGSFACVVHETVDEQELGLGTGSLPEVAQELDGVLVRPIVNDRTEQEDVRSGGELWLLLEEVAA